MTAPLAQISLTQTGLLPPLIVDYISGEPSVFRLHKYPFDFAAFKSIIADKAMDRIDRKLLVEVLKEQYSDIPTSSAVSNNIESLLSEKTFTITAAHQPCLLLGPLYNIYKIACAINVTRQLRQAFPEYNFAPVFWLGTEDHDIEELNDAYVNGKKTEWKNPGTGAIGRLKTDSLKPVIEELKSISPNPEIISVLENGLRKYNSFGKFNQYFVNEIFKEHGLVVIDQDDKRLKKRFSEVIKDETLHSKATEALKNNLEFLKANYKIQAQPRDINFFYLGGNYRERIILNDSTKQFEINNRSISFSHEEIIAEIGSHPERFSPNVIFRPLYQEMILPNLAFVGGAGELSYWLELKPLFDYYKVNYPMQILRNSAAIISQNTKTKLEKLNLKVEDFFGDVEQLINRYVLQNRREDASLEEEKRKINTLYDSISLKAEAVDATLKQNAAAERQKVLSAIENLEQKILKAEKRKHETAVNQIRNIHATLFPDGTLQERRENFIPYYDHQFIADIVSNSNPFNKSFHVFLSN